MTLPTQTQTDALKKTEFVVTSDASALVRMLEKTTPDSLVIFDVDMVLLHTKDPVFQMPNLIHHFDLIKAVRENLTPEESDLLLHFPLIDGEAEVIDSALPRLIRQLQSRNIPTIACTAILSGAIAPEPDMMKWRINQLVELDMDFSITAPDETLFHAIHFPKYRGNIPQYKKGVMITNGEHGPANKGTVLAAFLATLPIQPCQIIMIDDRRQNLMHIHDSLEKIEFNGDYIAVEFTAAMHHACPLVSADVFSEKLQIILERTKMV